MASVSEAIEALKAKSIEAPNVVPSPTAGQIAQAEDELGLKFPPSFLAFLEHAGAFTLPYWETYWVGDDALGYRNIVASNQSEREEVEPALPVFLVSFHNNGCGDQLCFDTRHPDVDGEYPIVFWDHELGVEENLSGLKAVAGNFAEWLMQEVEEAS